MNILKHSSIINDKNIKIIDIPKFQILVNSKIMSYYYKDIFIYLYSYNNNIMKFILSWNMFCPDKN